MKIDFWFDPGCPFCWRTARWILAVASARDLEILWRPLSRLQINSGGDDFPETGEPGVIASHRMLRVAARLANKGAESNALIERFYTEVGAQIHNDGVAAEEVDLAAILEALGEGADTLAAADDEGLDAPLRESMEAALKLAGDNVGTPVVGFEDGGAYFGPVIDPIPTGDAALRLFDAVATLATTPGLWELKRSRPDSLSPLQDRPETAIPGPTG